MEQSNAAQLKSALAKASWRILPLLTIGYLFAYIDRVNVSFASTKMNVDLGFSATVYGFGAGVFYLAYSLVEIPSNVLLMRVGARRWLARIMIMWGLIASAMIFVKTPTHFYVLRFLLGLSEAGFFPGVIYYLSTWFPSRQRGKAMGMFYLANPMAVAVVGLVSTGLLGLDGHAGLKGWQWLFLVQGLPAAFIGLALLAFLPDSPRTAPWLSTAERSNLETALGHTDAPEHHDAHGLLAILADKRVLLLTLIYSLALSSSTTFILSGPAILMERTGWKLGDVGTLISWGGLSAAVMMLFAGWLTDRRGERFGVLFFALALDTAGYLAVVLSPSAAVIAAGFIVSQIGRGMHSTAQVAIWADVLKHRRMAIGAAAISTIANLATWLLPIGFGAMKDATHSYTAGLWLMPLFNVLALFAAIPLYRIVRRD